MKIGRKPLLFFLFLSSVASSQSVEIDSLLRKLPMAVDIPSRVDILNQLSFAYHRISLDRAEEVADDASTLAIKHDYTKGIASANSNLGVCACIRGDYSRGLDYFLKCLTIREEERDTAGIAKTLNNIAGVYRYEKNFPKALEYAEHSLDLIRARGDKLGEGNICMGVGLLYKDLQEWDKSLESFLAASAAFESIGNEMKIGEALLNISDLYLSSGDYDKAMEHCQGIMNRINTGNNKLQSTRLILTISKIHAAREEPTLALINVKHAYKLAIDFDDNDAQLQCLEWIAELFDRQAQNDSAKYYRGIHDQLSRATFTREESEKMEQLEKLYDSDKQLRALLNAAAQPKKPIPYPLIGSMVLGIVALLGFVYLLLRRRSR